MRRDGEGWGSSCFYRWVEALTLRVNARKVNSREAFAFFFTIQHVGIKNEYNGSHDNTSASRLHHSCYECVTLWFNTSPSFNAWCWWSLGWWWSLALESTEEEPVRRSRADRRHEFNREVNRSSLQSDANVAQVDFCKLQSRFVYIWQLWFYGR